MAELVHECIRGTSASAEPASRSGASSAAGAGAAGMCGIYDVVVSDSTMEWRLSCCRCRELERWVQVGLYSLTACCPQLDGDDSVMMLVRLNAIAKQWQTDS